MTRYHGLCINGPMARKSASCETNRLRVEMPQEILPLTPVLKDLRPVPIETFEYVFTVVESLDVGSHGETLRHRGFWIPSNVRGDRTLYVIDELANAYAKGGAA